MHRFVKDPDATKDYSWDWSDFLAEGETIEDTEILEPGGELEVVGNPTHDEHSVTAWLSGGLPGHQYFITCRIITSMGRSDDRSLYLLVKEL